MNTVVTHPLEDHYRDTTEAFDSVAIDYNGAMGNNPLVQHMRASMWRSVTKLARPVSRLLDLGCGTGLDAVHFAQRGYDVIAIDRSFGMLAQTRRLAGQTNTSAQVKVLQIGIDELHKLNGETFDVIYSDMGALNCLDTLEEVASACSLLLRRGGHLVVSVMGRYCPWEILYYTARGYFARARLRLEHGQIPVSLNRGTVWTRYYTPAELFASFSTWFVLRNYRALNLFLPPPYLIGAIKRVPALFQPLAWLDQRLCTFPVFRQAGDHFLMEMQRHD